MFNIHCSKLARPMTCAGSLFFKDLPKEEPGEAAKEGTAAGEYLERLLLKTPIGTHARNGVLFDEDMKFYGKQVADRILSDAASPILCETKIDWQTQSTIVIKGQYDASFIGKDGSLYIDDLKYGWGLVEAEDNWQLIGYAIGEVIRRNEAFPKIVLRIHQPRPHHEAGPTREWHLTYDQLLAYKDKIEARMQQIADGEKSLQTSAACKYCPAASACPAFNKAYHRGVEVVHEFLQDHLDEYELAFQMDMLTRIEDIVKTRKGSLEQLIVSRIKEGKLIPDYIIEDSYGNREWKPSVTPNVIKLMTGKDITDQGMLSPAKAEKVGVPKEVVAAMTDRRFKGQKVVRKDTGALGDKIFGAPKQGAISG